jgi:DNA polymerase III subunit epsilon
MQQALKLDPNLIYKNWRDLPMVILDTETTGLDPASDDFHVIQFAAILVIGDKVFETLNIFINPGMSIPEKVVSITGITDEQVANAPPFEDVADQIYSFILKGDILCAFNADFDKSALRAEFNRIGYPMFAQQFFDPLIWEREKRSSGNTQGEVAKRYGCGRIGRVLHGEGSLHNAMVDVEVLWDIVRAMSERLPFSYSDLIETQSRYRKAQLEHRAMLEERKRKTKKKA